MESGVTDPFVDDGGKLDPFGAVDIGDVPAKAKPGSLFDRIRLN
jgi:hypothetical protein